MKQYHELLEHILTAGSTRDAETDQETVSVFGYQADFDLSDQTLPVITTNSIPFRWTAEELFWYISGDTNTNTLRAKGIPLWSTWSTREQSEKWDRASGDLGPAFTGFLWRSFGGNFPKHDGADQLAILIREIETNPSSRRLILAGWDPSSCMKTDTPPCHTLTQFHIDNKRVLNCIAFFRSYDAFNYAHSITTYALLTRLIAHTTNLEPGKLSTTFGDLHLYSRDIPNVHEVLTRQPYPSPMFEILDPDKRFRGLTGLLEIRYEHLRLHNYQSHPQLSQNAA